MLKTLMFGLVIKTTTWNRYWDQDHTPRSTDHDEKFAFSTFRRNIKQQVKF